MNVSSALGLPKVLPTEKDLPSLPTVDTRKKRKQPKAKPALPHRRSQGSRWKKSGGWQKMLWSSGEKSKRDGAGSLSFLHSRLSAGGEGQHRGGPEGPPSELDELVALCQRIEEECFAADHEEKEEETDEFLAVKKRMEDTIRNTHMLIEERRTIRAAKGTTLETVRLGGEIDDNLSLLRELFEELSTIYGQQFKARKKKNLSDEDMEERHADINRLMRAIEELRRDSKRTASSHGGGSQNARLRTLTELQSGSFALQRNGVSERPITAVWGEAVDGDGGSSPAGRGPQVEEVSEEDRATMKRWKARDEEFDKQVEEIGDAIDRIAHVAVQIGENADLHHELIQNVHGQTDQAATEIQHLNAKVKGILGKQSNTTFFTRLLLIVILVFLICFVISTVYARYIKKA
ncbi:hypothetical protein BESB_030820 [Besnoitia besnoiti]|uniref:t-SNARE coiled-coil homology domain-containing protein n=1 Tax=Besnoitia besnoiti TaxID=94643 RepID=A0A2A9LXJ8_BESBE|nr:hypothetical protein BESB_030820 [Besnoitia besnoiti]PFH31208.1 hypothetical protein BESB_030820 [Besnoitia besnoiti]